MAVFGNRCWGGVYPRPRVFYVCIIFFATGCPPLPPLSDDDGGVNSTDTEDDSETGTDADADTDVDTDTDSDTDSNADADTDADTDIDGDSDTDIDSDGGSDTDVDADTDTDIDAGTDSGIDGGNDAGDRCVDGEQTVSSVTGIVWVTVCGGTYDMGTTLPSAAHDDEHPMHPVNVPEFEIAKTETTVAQYEGCVLAGECTVPSTADYCAPGAYGNWDAVGYQDHPVNCVTWSQAAAFCSWADGRLPSESEWEYAARSGGQNIRYPWGDMDAGCDYAVMDDEILGSGCGTSSTWAACGKTAGNSAQGVCDLSGNVWEWVQDWYHGSYDCDANPSAHNCGDGGVAPDDGSAWGGSSSHKIKRGSCFIRTAWCSYAANRSPNMPSTQAYFLGFRCAR